MSCPQEVGHFILRISCLQSVVFIIAYIQSYPIVNSLQIIFHPAFMDSNFCFVLYITPDVRATNGN